MSASQSKGASPLVTGKWYAKIEDNDRFGGLYECVNAYDDPCLGERVCVMVNESEHDEPRYIVGPNATAEFWAPQV